MISPHPVIVHFVDGSTAEVEPREIVYQHNLMRALTLPSQAICIRDLEGWQWHKWEDNGTMAYWMAVIGEERREE